MIFIVLSSWPQVIARVHSVHLMKCRTAHKRLSTLRPSPLTWAVSPPVGCYRLQPPSPFIIITQPKSWYSFTVPRRVEGWVDLGTAGMVHTARAQGCKSQWFYDKHNCPQPDSIPGPRALQSDMLPLDHCDLHQSSWEENRFGLDMWWKDVITALPNNHCSGYCKASEEESHQKHLEKIRRKKCRQQTSRAGPGRWRW